MNNFILKRIQDLGCKLIYITEELVSVYYRGHNYLVNKSGTIVLSAFTQTHPRYQYAVYKGQLYCLRTIIDDSLHNEMKVTQCGGGCILIGRLMLFAFGHFVKDEEKRSYYVKYLDGDYHNCHIDNLQWIKIQKFCVNQQIKKKGYCTKIEAQKLGMSRLTLTDRLKTHGGDLLSSTVNFERKRNHCDVEYYGYLSDLSKQTGIAIQTLRSRYVKGDRGEQLIRKPRLLKNHV